MKVALKAQYLRKKDGRIYGQLVEYYQKSKLGKNSQYHDYEEAARGFVEKIGVAVSVISSEQISFEDEDVFTFRGAKNPNERLYWFFNFQNFYRALNNVIDGHQPKAFSNEGAERQMVLKKEAFKYIGHNETKIKHSKSSYALLFD